MEMSPRQAVTLNALALYGISAVLLVAFYWQLAYDELPCPLCLLQRVAFAALAVGPILTIRHGPSPHHLGLVVIAAALGAVISSRQVLLHILPGDPGYGSALLGLHFYSWAFVTFAGALIATGAMLVFFPQKTGEGKPPATSLIEHAAVWLVMALVALNALSVLLECGFSACPANPVQYQLLGQ